MMHGNISNRNNKFILNRLKILKILKILNIWICLYMNYNEQIYKMELYLLVTQNYKTKSLRHLSVISQYACTQLITFSSLQTIKLWKASLVEKLMSWVLHIWLSMIRRYFQSYYRGKYSFAIPLNSYTPLSFYWF